jgi:hypothetical protein
LHLIGWKAVAPSSLVTKDISDALQIILQKLARLGAQDMARLGIALAFVSGLAD